MTIIEQIKSLTKEEVITLVQQYDSLTDVMRHFNVKRPRNTNNLRRIFLSKVQEYEINWSRDTRNVRRSFTKEQLAEAIKAAYCWSDVLRAVGLKPHGNNSETIKRLAQKYDISTEHFDIKAAYKRKMVSSKTRKIYGPDDLHLITHRSILRRVVLQHNLIEYKCNMCSNEGQWLNKPIILQLDHIDGDSNNNVLTNLRFLCPNCHSQTDTFGSKNRVS